MIVVSSPLVIPLTFTSLSLHNTPTYFPPPFRLIYVVIPMSSYCLNELPGRFVFHFSSDLAYALLYFAFYFSSASYVDLLLLYCLGMDGKLCLWDTSRATCVDIRSHFGSITKVLTDPQQDLALSSGYDGKVYIYSLGESLPARGGGRGKQAVGPSVKHCLTGHKAPILDITMNQHVLCSGARDGDVYMWDIHMGTVLKRYHGHKGAVNKVLPITANPHLFVSAGVDGCVKLYDTREKSCVLNVLISCSEVGGMASVGALISLPQGHDDSCFFVTGGADNAVSVVDMRQTGGDILHRWMHHKNAVYSLCAAGSDCVFSGDGEGMMLCYDVKSSTNKALAYGIAGSEVGAVQCILQAKNNIIGCGDSGKLLIYEFE